MKPVPSRLPFDLTTGLHHWEPGRPSCLHGGTRPSGGRSAAHESDAGGVLFGTPTSSALTTSCCSRCLPVKKSDHVRTRRRVPGPEPGSSRLEVPFGVIHDERNLISGRHFGARPRRGGCDLQSAGTDQGVLNADHPGGPRTVLLANTPPCADDGRRFSGATPATARDRFLASKRH